MDKNKKAKNDTGFKSVFVIRMIYSSEKIKYPAKLECETLGYFTDLKKAEYYISYPDKESFWFLEDTPFKIYEIAEYGTNYFLMDIRVRIYDNTGAFYGEHPSDYDRGYPGREHEDCKFKPGDFVEFIDGLNRLDAGIVLGLPPDKKSVKEIAKRACTMSGFNIHPFDSSDDCYMVLNGYGRFDYSHPQVFKVFKPSAKIKGTLRRNLTIRYQKYVAGLSTKQVSGTK
jgi:hypothetical protein